MYVGERAGAGIGVGSRNGMGGVVCRKCGYGFCCVEGMGMKKAECCCIPLCFDRLGVHEGQRSDRLPTEESPPPADRLFNCVNYCFESLGLVERQICQNLAVQGDAFGVNLTHEFRIGHTVGTSGGVDTRDPQ